MEPNIFNNIIPSHWYKLDNSFYQRNDVVKIARELLGKILVTYFDNILTAARIVETEAYKGVIDKASHAYGNRRTDRTEIMYGAGGVAYVYLCYGIHHLFNVVTNVANTPHAILIRAAEPIVGLEDMLIRTGKKKADYTLTKGPGNVSKALGIYKHHTSLDLTDNTIFIVDDGYKLSKQNIVATARIGVDYAGADALLPYRFFIKDNPYVSGKKVKL
ncbi:MAG: DNA-3-methyladenine glycosylase [Ilyomonas sp.]